MYLSEFPDVFGEGGDPIGEAKDNWMKARRAILRSPLDRIGYGGYLKLASEWPGFIEEIQSVVGEFRQILSLIHISEPTRRTPISYAVFCLKKKKKTIKKKYKIRNKTKIMTHNSKNKVK